MEKGGFISFTNEPNVIHDFCLQDTVQKPAAAENT